MTTAALTFQKRKPTECSDTLDKMVRIGNSAFVQEEILAHVV